MSKVAFGFSTPSKFNPVSWVVRKLTGSQASHTWFLYFDEDFKMWMVMEAHELGFRLLPFKRFRDANKVVAIYSTRTSVDDGLRWAASWLGTAYDFKGLLGMFWVILGRVFSRKWKNPMQNTHAMFCSEMAVTVLQSSGVDWSKQLDPTEATPQDVLNSFEAEFKKNGDSEIFLHQLADS